MAGPNLPVNIDTTYTDSTADPSVKTHQQHHDVIHTLVNRFDTTAPTATGMVPMWNAPAGVYVPTVPQVVQSMTGTQRMWVRTAAQGFPTAAEGAVDGDLLIIDAT